MKWDISRIKQDFQEFIIEYQKSLWLSKTTKFETIIPIITLHDLLFHFGYDCSLKEFKDFLTKHQDLNLMINEFITNNFIHYASSIKHKELLQEYKESNIVIESNYFNLDASDIQTFNNIGIKLNNNISLATGLDSDIDQQTQDEILKDVDKFE